MSFFMVTAGPAIDTRGLAPLELIRAADAQTYIRHLVDQLSALDGAPLYLVHDGATGTSDDLITAAVNAAGGDALGSAVLRDVLDRLVAAGHTIRIWWASGASDAHLRVEECTSPADLLERLRQLGPVGGVTGVRLSARKS